MKDYLFIWANFFGSDHECIIPAHSFDDALIAFKQTHPFLFRPDGTKVKDITCYIRVNW